jgi:predicted acylesterase/phospholipase RssA
MASASSSASPYDAVVFAGGGCRCFWQAGFWQEAAPALGLAPRRVTAVSAGAAFACAALTGTTARVLADFKQRAAANERNVYPRNALRRAPVFPHEAIYRGTIDAVIDTEILALLQEGPELRVLLTRPPAWLGQRASIVAGMAAYALDRRELRVHARWGRRFGFAPELVSVRSCRAPTELADLILHSSCMPPLVPLYRRGERIVLDGGLIDNAPADFTGPARAVLVLLTRDYGEAKLPRVPGRTYVQPSRPIPIQKWDYTSPQLVQQTFDLGRRDGEAFAASHRERRRDSLHALG